VGAVVVEDHVDHLAGGDFGLNGIEEANELLVAMAFHAAAVGEGESGSENGPYASSPDGPNIPIVYRMPSLKRRLASRPSWAVSKAMFGWFWIVLLMELS
jgi:hypothetical protein